MAQSTLPSGGVPAGSSLESSDWQQRGPLALARDALLLREDAFAAVRLHPSPFARGALILVVILAIVAVARLIGLALGLATAPQVGQIEQALANNLTSLGWYQNQVAQNPEFADQFARGYELIWQGIRLALGVPVPTVTFAGIVGLVVSTFIVWLLYGGIAHLMAKWLGGKASWGQFMGPLALMYAPLLLTVVELVPGAQVPTLLLFLAQLVLAYLAVKTTYGLSVGANLAIILAPYVILLLLVVILGALGIGYGLGQIPIIDTVTRALRIIPGVGP